MVSEFQTEKSRLVKRRRVEIVVLVSHIGVGCGNFFSYMVLVNPHLMS